MAVHAMMHETDPKQEIVERFGDISGLDLMHNQILVATYTRPEKTKGGIILTDTTRKEDHYQGKVGLVLAKGPMAFRDDKDVSFAGQDVDVGEWVYYRAADGWQLTINGQHARLLQDTQVRGKVNDPDLVY